MRLTSVGIGREAASDVSVYYSTSSLDRMIARYVFRIISGIHVTILFTK